MPKNSEERIIDLPFNPSARRASGGGSSGGGGGATSFLGLSDTPSGYAGKTLFYVRVNAAGTGLEFVEVTPGGVDSVNGLSGTVVLDTDDIAEGAANLYASAANVGAVLHAATEKVTIHDNDEFGGIDTESSNVLTWWKWSTIRATLKTYLDALYAPKAASGARVYNSANISIPDSSFTNLTFNSERFDTGSIHSTSSNTGRLTAPVTGKYLISASLAFVNNATGLRIAGILLNGTTNLAAQSTAAFAGTSANFSLTTIYHLTAGDYVEVSVYQTSGGPLNVSASGNFSPEFSMILLGT